MLSLLDMVFSIDHTHLCLAPAIRKTPRELKEIKRREDEELGSQA